MSFILLLLESRDYKATSWLIWRRGREGKKTGYSCLFLGNVLVRGWMDDCVFGIDM